VASLSSALDLGGRAAGALSQMRGLDVRRLPEAVGGRRIGLGATVGERIAPSARASSRPAPRRYARDWPGESEVGRPGPIAAIGHMP